MTVAENKQIVERVFDTLRTGDFGPLDALLAPGALIHQCGFLEPHPVGAFLNRAAFGGGPIVDREVRLEHIIAEGDLVALHWRMGGRFSSPGEPEIDGKPVSVPCMTFVRLEGGKIAEIWNIRDTSTLETQLREPAASVG